MTDRVQSRPIQWRVHLRAAPADVYDWLDSARGREAFWAHSAPETAPGTISFRFINGECVTSRILLRDPPTQWHITYFRDSIVQFELHRCHDGSTDLTVRESSVPDDAWHDNFAGWVSVLLSLKAAVDFGVDLRNGDASRTWTEGFVDV